MKPKASEGEKPKRSDTATGYHFSNIKKNKIMKKFKVTVTETLTKDFFVDEEGREDATNKVATAYYKASADEYILTASDYQGTTIKAEEL